MPSSRVSTARATFARRGVARAAGLVALLALALIASAPASQAQSSVTIRAGVHDGYGRLVFDWPKPVRFEASLTGDQLVVRFAEPLSADLSSAAVRRFDDYLTRPVLSSDRRSITFDLVRNVTLRSFQNDRSSVIDLLNAPGPRPERKAEASQAAAAPVPEPEKAAPQLEAKAAPQPE